MKKTVALILATILLLSISLVYADSDPVRVISLEEAQAMALQNNVQYNLQDSYIDDAVDAYDDQEDANDKAQSKASNSFLAYFNKPITLDTTLQGAANNVKLARFKKDNIKRTSDINVKLSFIRIKKAQYALDDAKNDTYLKNMDYESAKIKCQLGIITSDDLKTFEKAYTDAAQAEDTALKSLQQEMQTLNRYLGRVLTDYNLQPELTLTTINVADINLDKIRQDYINNKSDLYQLSLNADLAKQKYDLTKDRYDDFVVKKKVMNSRDDMESAMDTATRDYDNARTAFEDATKELDLGLNSTYNSIKNSMEAIDRLYRDIDDMKTDVQKSKLKYDLGLMSKIDYDKKEMGLKTMQNKLNSAIADLNTLYTNLTMYSSTTTNTNAK